jgi:hypothetical protein
VGLVELVVAVREVTDILPQLQVHKYRRRGGGAGDTVPAGNGGSSVVITDTSLLPFLNTPPALTFDTQLITYHQATQA